uniref:SKP1 component POZ domain-containing protein n=1 Tax=Triticum aestivum TaxID=4565 RepID=A0A080YUU1_WHEAT|nr:unnamed protein product [Triticum aestivum]
MALAEEKTFLLETLDGMSFVVSEREASQSGEIHCDTICYRGRPIDVNVQGKTLAKALHYCKKHAYSGGHDLRAWDAKFVGDLDLETLYDLILVSFSDLTLLSHKILLSTLVYDGLA